MASPPPPGGAASPPGSSFGLPNSRKRPSISTSSSMIKRRKPSFAGSATSSNHPLRQTSFPPEPASAVDQSRQSSFSPSVISQGQSSLAGTTAPKKRGRKPKNAAAGDESKSATGSARTRENGGKGGAAADDEDDDDDDEGEGQADAVFEGGERGQMTESARRLEREHMLMLMDAFDGEQFERYEIWRRVRLKKETVRKIVNQTLSQSVPASVVTTVMTSTKIFIGELVESAREVQSEWAASAEVLPSGQRNPRFTVTNGRPNGEPSIKNEGDHGEPANGVTSKPLDVKERDKGPLLPDHLREALRRYKRDREGGSVGFQGMSLHGVEGTSSRTGGRRLFR